MQRHFATPPCALHNKIVRWKHMALSPMRLKAYMPDHWSPNAARLLKICSQTNDHGELKLQLPQWHICNHLFYKEYGISLVTVISIILLASFSLQLYIYKFHVGERPQTFAEIYFASVYQYTLGTLRGMHPRAFWTPKVTMNLTDQEHEDVADDEAP